MKKEFFALMSCVLLLGIATIILDNDRSNAAPAQPQALLPWSEWYPMDRAQPPGYRTFNWWTKTNGDPQLYGYNGQSTWNYPDTPDTFPEFYRGTSTTIDYFYNWKCTYPFGDSRDPQCEIWSAQPDWPNHIYSQLEIISESPDDEELQHWAFGSRANWRVFYLRSAIVNGAGNPTCTRDNIQARYDTAYLQRTDIKQPLVMKLPDSDPYVGPPVCAIAYGGWEQDPDTVIPNWTGTWFVETRFIDMSTTGNCSPYPCILAENIYFSDNPTQRDAFTYCDTPGLPDYDAYCDGGTLKGRLGTTYDGAEAVTGWAFAFERYWMRQVPAANRRSNGFGAFLWWEQDGDFDWDDTYGSQPGDPLGWSPYQYCQLRPSGLDVVCCDAPVSGADFDWTPAAPIVGQAVTFNASAGGSTPISYAWDFGDDSSASGNSVAHTYTAGGDYTVIMTATNACSQQVVNDTVHVCAPASGADFDWTPTAPAVGQTMTFTASANGSTPISYTWDFGDGPPTTGALSTHTYDSSGTYTVTLTASNACGQDEAEHSLAVTAEVQESKIYLPLLLKN